MPELNRGFDAAALDAPAIERVVESYEKVATHTGTIRQNDSLSGGVGAIGPGAMWGRGHYLLYANAYREIGAANEPEVFRGRLLPRSHFDNVRVSLLTPA